MPFILPFFPPSDNSQPWAILPPNHPTSSVLFIFVNSVIRFATFVKGHQDYRLQERNCHNICIKLKLIAGLPSALLLSLLRAYRRASLIWPSWLISFPHWAYLLLPLCPDPPIRHSQRYGSRPNAPHATSKCARCSQARLISGICNANTRKMRPCRLTAAITWALHPTQAAFFDWELSNSCPQDGQQQGQNRFNMMTRAQTNHIVFVCFGFFFVALLVHVPVKILKVTWWFGSMAI